MKSIGIIGGGPAGLAVAHDLAVAGHQVTVFEALPELGGLARSFWLGEARIERYYHFICADDLAYCRKLRELGIEHSLNWRTTRMGFFHNGTLYPFSSSLDLLRFAGISMAGRLRYGALVLYCWFRNHWQQLDTVAAEAWLKRFLGDESYMATWYPLLKVKFGEQHDRISAAWAWHRVHRVARSRKTPLHREMLGFLEGGTQTLIDTLANDLKRLGATLLPGQPVTRVRVDGDRVTSIETAEGRQFSFDAVVSTVPLPVLLDIAPDLPAGYRRQLSAIDLIGVICLALRLCRPLTANFWLNINDPRVPFNGCIEFSNLNKGMTPDGSTILYVPFYLPTSHERFGYSDQQLFSECVRALAVVHPEFSEDWVLDYAVSRDRFAQVVCCAGFAQQVPGHTTPIRNLYVIDSSQLYPADRTISGMFDLSRAVAMLIGDDQSAGDAN